VHGFFHNQSQYHDDVRRQTTREGKTYFNKKAISLKISGLSLMKWCLNQSKKLSKQNPSKSKHETNSLNISPNLFRHMKVCAAKTVRNMSWNLVFVVESAELAIEFM